MSRVAAIAVALCGCGSKVIPLDAVVGDPAPVETSVFWTLRTAAGVVQPRLAGSDTAAVVPFEAPANYPPYASFPCAAGMGLVMLPDYDRMEALSVLRIENATTGEIFDESPAIETGPPPAIWRVTFITDGTPLRLHWTVSQGGSPSTCAMVGNPLLSLQVTPAAGPVWTAMTDCSAATATTDPLASGPASIVITSGAVSGSASATVPTDQPSADAPTIDLAF